MTRMKMEQSCRLDLQGGMNWLTPAAELAFQLTVLLHTNFVLNIALTVNVSIFLLKKYLFFLLKYFMDLCLKPNNWSVNICKHHTRL